jgi:hypothetical protein
MHVLDYIVDSLSRLFRFNRYPLGEKAYSVMFHAAGLSLRDLLERYCVTIAENRKHGKRAKSKSIHIQHTNKHADKIRKDKQKKNPER